MLAALGGNLRRSHGRSQRHLQGEMCRFHGLLFPEKLPSPVERFGIEVIVGVLGTTCFASLC